MSKFSLKNKHDFKISIFKNDDVIVDKNAFEELDNLLKLSETIEKIKDKEKDFFDIEKPEISEVVLTPDFHKGSGIPIGTVLLTKGFIVPQAVGNDVNCGMRFYTTNLSEDKIFNNFEKLEKKLRHIFFEGGRDIPMCKNQRESIFREGLTGIHETYKYSKGKGIWKYYDSNEQEKELSNVNNFGTIKTNKTFGLEDFIGNDNLTYDNQTGSIGGGNHFVEVQKVCEIFDPQTSYAFGLKKDQVVIMLHTGSVSIGHLTGSYFKDIMKEIYPKSLSHPENGIYLLPDSEKYKEQWDLFWSSLANSANFAFANRLFLGLMVKKAITEEIGELEMKLLYDASHNLVWEQNIDNKKAFLHRKGACPARGMEQMKGTNFEFYGEPVIIPGSMGSSSYILAGTGNRDSLFSASHGAGRMLSRGEALKYSDEEFKAFIENFKIITPLDPKSQIVKNRADILNKWKEDLKKEAPFAYKNITPVIQTHIDNNLARPVARLEPLFTIKG
jgi:tRNA-splicing ligase RtcB